MKIKILLLTCLLAQGCVYKATAIAHIKGLNSNPINGVAKFVEENGLVTLVLKLRDTDSESLQYTYTNTATVTQSMEKALVGIGILPMKIMVNGVFHHFIAEILETSILMKTIQQTLN